MKDDLALNIVRPKKEKKLPEVLSQNEVRYILDNVTNLKHKAILFLIYSSGLRVGEVVRLKLKDIDSNRMLIHVVQGKGRKDRYTVLAEVALKILREYVREYKPAEWLFQGEQAGRHITERTVQRIFENAKVSPKSALKSLLDLIFEKVFCKSFDKCSKESFFPECTAIK